ncbi:MAG: hypothetical protein OEW67_14035 [Cyclobacteriaceae bacterium]|nr:hypothetical protein [Cyclobacteriaceae bacterium]
MFIPKKTETLVLPNSSRELLDRLDEIVYTTENKLDRANEEDHHLFIGTIEESAFVISLKLNKVDNFIPLINGDIENTSKGSIVFLKYTLFKSTRMFLVFWTVLIFLLSFMLIVFQDKVWYGSLALLVSLANYIVTIVNFRRKVKVSREYLMKVFS